MSLKITGLDKMRRKLERLKRNAQALHGTHEVDFDELFPPSFLATHTKFSSVADMFEKSGFKVENSEDFKAIPDEPWDEFIRANSNFADWAEMRQASAGAYAKRKIFG